MEFYLQFGHGMMDHCKHFVEKWSGGTVIASPRDLELVQIQRFASEIRDRGGNVVVDPQFYLPHSDHERLTKHTYWPANYNTASFNRSSVNAMLNTLKSDYNDNINSPFFILPGIKTRQVNDTWFDYQDLFVKAAHDVGIERPKYHTICLSNDVLKSEDQVHLLLEYLEAWNDLDGFYIVPEPPAQAYLVEDPNWILNLMDLCAGIKDLSKKVVVGYCSHQMLCLALSKVDAIASGTWLNVRSFKDEKFQKAEDSTSRRSLWYYCPQALSEYQITFLDMANRVGKLELMKTDSIFDSPYGSILFSGAQPTTVNYTERESFRQYIQCFKVQANSSNKSDYHETLRSLRMQLETSAIIVSELRNKGVRSVDRDFLNVVDYVRSAVDVFDQLRGLRQNHNWERT